MIQVEGIPMGGKVSVQLANLDMMRKEVEGKKWWLGQRKVSTWMRFRDDFRAVFAGKVNKVRLEEIREGLEKMCESRLEIELEGFGYEKMEFLDMNVFVRNGVFVISDNNKNVNLWDEKKEKSEWRCRFPI